MTPIQSKARKYSLIALMLMVMGSLGLDQASKVTAENNLMVWQSETNLKEYQGRRYPVWSTGELSSPLMRILDFTWHLISIMSGIRVPPGGSCLIWTIPTGFHFSIW